LSPDYAFGPLSLAALKQSIAQARSAQDRYNQLLAEADQARREFIAQEAIANDLATRLLASVRSQFGSHSPEYLTAGGKPKPTRRKRRSPAKGVAGHSQSSLVTSVAT
jgi:hypothetical protein